MYEILTGKQKALVFPVMCNGHVVIDYRDNVPDTTDDDGETDTDDYDDVAYGLWSHTGGFTFEAVVTPYDINGYGTQSGYAVDGSAFPPNLSNISSTKIMPALAQSIYTAGTEVTYQADAYMPRGNAISHEMRIFHNSNFQVSLLNSTPHNENQPAEYKLKVVLLIGDDNSPPTYETITATSDKVILSSNTRSFKWESTANDEGFNSQGRIAFEKAATFTNANGTSITNANTLVPFFVGQEVFMKDGFDFNSLGTIAGLSGTTITLTTSSSTSISSTTTDLWLPTLKNATYVNDAFHIACSFDSFSNEIRLYLNGALINTTTTSSTKTFRFSRDDIYIGANGTGATGTNSAISNKQFMGEIHELCISNVTRKQFPSVLNLLPNYDNTLLYLRFEEADE